MGSNQTIGKWLKRDKNKLERKMSVAAFEFSGKSQKNIHHGRDKDAKTME